MVSPRKRRHSRMTGCSGGKELSFADVTANGKVAPIPVAGAMTIDQLTRFISRGRSASACGARWPGMLPLAYVRRNILTRAASIRLPRIPGNLKSTRRIGINDTLETIVDRLSDGKALAEELLRVVEAAEIRALIVVCVLAEGLSHESRDLRLWPRHRDPEPRDDLRELVAI